MSAKQMQRNHRRDLLKSRGAKTRKRLPSIQDVILDCIYFRQPESLAETFRISVEDAEELIDEAETVAMFQLPE